MTKSEMPSPSPQTSMATLAMPPVRTRPRTKRADDILFHDDVVSHARYYSGRLCSQLLYERCCALRTCRVCSCIFTARFFLRGFFLFVIQSCLVSAGNIRLHRKLGILGAVIAGLMVVLGVLAPFGTLRRGAVLPPIFTPASFLFGKCDGDYRLRHVCGSGGVAAQPFARPQTVDAYCQRHADAACTGADDLSGHCALPVSSRCYSACNGARSLHL